MNKLKSVLYLGAIFILSSCSSLNADAEKAAKLNKESIKYTREYQWSKASSSYQKAQEIIKQYEATEEYEEFYQKYAEYMYGCCN